MIISAICALCVQAKKRWRQVTSQGESRHGATEGAPRAAPQAPAAYQQTSAAESAPRAALQAQIADPEPSPQSSCSSSSSQKTLKQNTAQPRADEQGSSKELEPRKIFYSRDGMKVGIYHTSRNCGNLKSANAIFEKEFSVVNRKHRLCKICEHAKKA